MPHITVEYTQNVPWVISIDRLVSLLHDTARLTGAFPTGGIRTFARPSVVSLAGDGSGSNAFVQVQIRIAPGRTKQLKQEIAKALFDAARTELQPLFQAGPAALQLEITEFDPDLTFSLNTMITGETS